MKFLFLSLLLAAASPAWSESGRTGAAILRQAVGARPVGLAEAFTAVHGGASSMLYNPAGTLGARPSLEMGYTRGLVDDDFSFVGYSHPLSSAAVFIAFQHYDGGTVDINLSNGLSERRQARRDMVWLVGASFPLGHGLSIGGLAKGFHLVLADEVKHTGFAADSGVLWDTPLKGLTFGVAVQNIGPDVRFETTGDPLPLTYRYGTAYHIELDPHTEGTMAWISDLLLTADGVTVRGQTPFGAVGIETSAAVPGDRQAVVRLGYSWEAGRSFTMGVGAQGHRYSFDYGVGFDTLSKTHTVSFGIKF